jgi:hypothetical protein
MNKERLIQLAEVLESPAAEKHFDMKEWIEHTGYHDLPEGITIAEVMIDCGTVACIAGWATVLARPNEPYSAIIDEFSLAAEYLDLEYFIAKSLFTPSCTTDEGTQAYDADPKQAAKVVRHLAETGEVDWSIIDEPV